MFVEKIYIKWGVWRVAVPFKNAEWIQLARDYVTVMACGPQCNGPLGHIKMRKSNEGRLVTQDCAL
jgi:hypothetical protein